MLSRAWLPVHNFFEIHVRFVSRLRKIYLCTGVMIGYAFCGRNYSDLKSSIFASGLRKRERSVIY